MSPASLFARGVSYAGGVYTQRADELLDVIAQGGSGYHFLGKYARKFTMSADGFPAKFKAEYTNRRKNERNFRDL